MSLLKGFNAQGGRAPASPAANSHPDHNHEVGDQPNWGQQAHVPPSGGRGAQQPAPHQAAAPQGYGQPAPQWAPQGGQAPTGYGNPSYGHPGAAQGYGQPTGTYGSLSAQPDPYAPSFEPYAAAQAQPARAAQPSYQPQAYGQQAYAPQDGGRGHAAQHAVPSTGAAPAAHGQPAPQQWVQHQQPGVARGYETAGYQQAPNAAYGAAQYRQAEPHHHEAEPAFSDWQANPQQPYQTPQGYEHADAANGQYAGQQYANQQNADYDQQYADDENQDYEVEEPSRGRRPMMMVAALAGAILVGGGMAYGYKSFFGGKSNGQPPIVKSAAEPAKSKPADAGGKQFAHTDSKIMGRLGDGAPAAPAGETDANGTRKVSTLVVGRDGSIQAPAATPEPAPAPAAAAPVVAAAAPAAPAVAVPGMMVVDALGPKAAAATAAAAPPPPAAQQKIVVTPPAAAAAAPAKPVVVAKADTAATTGSIDAAAAAAAAPKKPVAPKKPAANDAYTTAAGAAPAASVPAAQPVATGPVTTGNGYVAVLASVPLSGSSRTEALKRYADMQQKYGGLLSGKTPDVTEANLGAKGQYHRLVVGPPASREQASSLCSQLKAQGYADCWVTSY